MLPIDDRCDFERVWANEDIARGEIWSTVSPRHHITSYSVSCRAYQDGVE